MRVDSVLQHPKYIFGEQASSSSFPWSFRCLPPSLPRLLRPYMHVVIRFICVVYKCVYGLFEPIQKNILQDNQLSLSLVSFRLSVRSLPFPPSLPPSLPKHHIKLARNDQRHPQHPHNDRQARTKQFQSKFDLCCRAYSRCALSIDGRKHPHDQRGGQTKRREIQTRFRPGM